MSRTSRFKALWAASALALMSGLPASAKADQDAVYHYRPAEELPVLRSYHRQPYWRALAECAGVQGVLMSRFDAAGDTNAAAESRRRAVNSLRSANSRLQADRGLSEREALLLTSPVVEAGRSSGETLLGQRRAGYPHSPEQIAVAMCDQLLERDAEVTRTRRR